VGEGGGLHRLGVCVGEVPVGLLGQPTHLGFAVSPCFGPREMEFEKQIHLMHLISSANKCKKLSNFDI
jgi:hypothetical protein